MKLNRLIWRLFIYLFSRFLVFVQNKNALWSLTTLAKSLLLRLFFYIQPKTCTVSHLQFLFISRIRRSMANYCSLICPDLSKERRQKLSWWCAPLPPPPFSFLDPICEGTITLCCNEGKTTPRILMFFHRPLDSSLPLLSMQCGQW